jgi:hypothetical protein
LAFAAVVPAGSCTPPVVPNSIVQDPRSTGAARPLWSPQFGPWFQVLGAGRQRRRGVNPCSRRSGLLLLAAGVLALALAFPAHSLIVMLAAALLAVALSQEVGLALGAQAGEARIRDVVEAGGFTRFRRVAETPFNLAFEARR